LVRDAFRNVEHVKFAVKGCLTAGLCYIIYNAIDSIAGFTIIFIVVTALAAWIVTSGPRLSYLGIQMALAFYLINLEEFAIRTSLAAARDRVVGILLGLIMMWLVFDQLWGSSCCSSDEESVHCWASIAGSIFKGAGVG